MFLRREEGLAATQEVGKATSLLAYGSPQPYRSAEGASVLLTVSCLSQPDPAQPLGVCSHGDVLLDQNGLILGQRGNSQCWDDT